MKTRSILKRGQLAVLTVVLILMIDQTIKILVKTNMSIEDHIRIASWFYIRFIENDGMAYGMNFLNKLFLSILRLVAISAIGYFIWLQVQKKAKKGYIFCLSMVCAGAAGNILDNMFYGLCFTDSTQWSVSALTRLGEGYAPFLKGKVVDMFYFPLIETHWPAWMPLVGGQHFIFFSPVFNFADACISVGFVMLLIFYRKELNQLSFKQ